jgi:glutamyl-tRNA reductase
VVLSTCNRTEVYACCDSFHRGVEELVALLARRAGCTVRELLPHVSVLHDDRALTHLFRVAAGTMSAVVGETEILGQVQRAVAAAEAHGTASALLSRAFCHAVRLGRRARAETGVASGAWSLPSVAVRQAAVQLGSLCGRRALVVGAGEMGRAAISALARAGIADITVATRSPEQAAPVNGRLVAMDDLPAVLEAVDVVLTATSSAGWVLERPLAEDAMARRQGRPLVVVDLALPRDVAPDVAAIPGITLFDLENLRAAVATVLAERRQHLPDVERLVAAEVDKFLQETSAREISPLVSALRCRVEEVRRAELRRWQARLGPLEPATLELVEAVTAGVVAKLLHAPTVRLKDVAGTVEAERYRDTLTELFDLGSAWRAFRHTDSAAGDPLANASA